MSEPVTTWFDRLLDKIAARLVNAMLPRLFRIAEEQEYSATVYRNQLWLSKGSSVFVRPIEEIIEWKKQ